MAVCGIIKIAENTMKQLFSSELNHLSKENMDAMILKLQQTIQTSLWRLICMGKTD